jgi:hypothetical protein
VIVELPDDAAIGKRLIAVSCMFRMDAGSRPVGDEVVQHPRMDAERLAEGRVDQLSRQTAYRHAVREYLEKAEQPRDLVGEMAFDYLFELGGSQSELSISGSLAMLTAILRTSCPYFPHRPAQQTLHPEPPVQSELSLHSSGTHHLGPTPKAFAAQLSICSPSFLPAV